MKKVVIAMSGGVDSSVVALKLKEEGFLCHGVTGVMYNEKKETPIYALRARRVCEQLGIKHTILNFTDEFKEKVINPFIKTYEEGKTPNPCILCNINFKFGRIFEYAMSLNYDYFATGHYARNIFDKEKKRWILKKSKNSNKDQTYFLYFLKQNQLERILFPLENLDKSVVKEIALKHGFESAKVKESQDICFVGGIKYSNFIKNNSNKKWEAGDFVDVNGKKLGVHNGIINYTIGQRKGIGLSFKEPMFVKEIDSFSNSVVLSTEKELFEDTILAKNLNYIAIEGLNEKINCSAKVRYRQNEEEATIYKERDDLVKIVFKNPQRAIARGQAVVFYDGEDVLGGGEIC